MHLIWRLREKTNLEFSNLDSLILVWCFLHCVMYCHKPSCFKQRTFLFSQLPQWRVQPGLRWFLSSKSHKVAVRCWLACVPFQGYFSAPLSSFGGCGHLLVVVGLPPLSCLFSAPKGPSLPSHMALSKVFSQHGSLLFQGQREDLSFQKGGPVPLLRTFS